MGTVWIKEFTGGLDTRRMPETTPGGVLIRASDGHITRGGEFEKRPAFVPAYQLAAGVTKGLGYTRAGLLVFGHEDAPSDMPSGVSYQQLVHPTDPDIALTRILSFDLNAGLPYVVAEFADGSRQHFYDGDLVTDWFDGRARASFTVKGTGGALTGLTVNGVAIIDSSVSWATDNATTATAIAAEINSYVSTPNYTAVATGEQVSIVASDSGSAANGRLVVFTVTSGFTAPATGLVLAGGGGEFVAPVQARGKFTVKVGTINQIDSINVLGGSELSVKIVGGVAYRTSRADTATAIAGAINVYSSSPDYTAAAVGSVVTVTAPIAGIAYNGRTLDIRVSGDIRVSNVTAFAGGTISDFAAATFTVSAGTPSVVSDIKVDGVSIIDSQVVYATSATAVAAAIAVAVNSHSTVPVYTATSAGEVVTIWAAASEGAAENGRAIAVTVTGGLSAVSISSLTGGVTGVDVFLPGMFVRTIGSKVYSVANSNLHFSGIQQPTKWTTATVGAGFVNLAAQASGAEFLKAVAEYQQYIAIFAENVTIIFYVDPDPNLNRKSQVLRNTGTSCPRSVTQFGDNDIYYLHESGLRSLQARDSSNAAATTDIGVLVDSLIGPALHRLSETERDQVIGLINPVDGRFWLTMLDQVFVFSFFSGSKVSAWSTYIAGYEDESGVVVPFNIEDAIVFNRRVHVRSGDSIYVFGGLADDPVYDTTQAEAWLPYFDANKPTEKKEWTGIDAAVEGTWVVRAAMQPTDLNASDLVATIDKTTYNLERVAGLGNSSHLGLRFKSEGSGPAKLSAAVLHYAGGKEES